ncbi:hypothetical protein UFOVP58_135 [uncultured Caudovirales phage]|uniref:Uncharacterized protein n=1 Tax=uncultured Caudovirales phage TaxID=2100421 RepID=A0A6J5KWY2_9CAUD|nr:hypothetical protein UFOVP58_135 [uncultured Caudovirales phage]
MAISSNLFIDQGTAFSVVVDINNDNGTNFDLTSYTALAQIRRTYGTTTAINFTATINVVNSTVTLSLTPAQTAALSGRYVYDLIITSTGTATRVVQGVVVVDPSVTRA